MRTLASLKPDLPPSTKEVYYRAVYTIRDLNSEEVELVAAQRALTQIREYISVVEHTGADPTNCIECSAPLTEQRKEANPIAIRCIGCQNMIENGQNLLN